jgi:hypothetical protein
MLYVPACPIPLSSFKQASHISETVRKFPFCSSALTLFLLYRLFPLLMNKYLPISVCVCFIIVSQPEKPLAFKN